MVVNWREFDWYSLFCKHGLIPRAKRQRRDTDKRDIFDIYSAFDIETSTVWLDPDIKKYNVHSFMYSWAFQIEEYTALGRTWETFLEFVHCIESVCTKYQHDKKMPLAPKLVCYCHNLAYEWAYLSGIYPFSNEECFFRDARKPLYIRMFGILEIRCSYLQTNLSLEMLCKQMGVPEKKSGQEFDYKKIRFPWTLLTDYELEYIITDVESLVLAMKKRITMNGDNLLTAPLTSTGYVRRECKASLKDRFFDMRDMKPDERQYRLLRAAFRGGNTHGQAAYAGKIVENVNSYDIVSCYPTQQLTQMFPMKPFKWLDSRLTLDRVMQFIGMGYAVIGMYQFKNLRLKNKKTPIPYISLARTDTLMYREEEIAVKLKSGKIKNKKIKVSLVKLDNGRILESYYTKAALTEIDLRIVLQQYTFDEIGITECMVAKKDFLPKEYRDVIQTYYNNKTKLKGDDTDAGQYLYQKSKNMLNAVYGMSATDPIHQEITYTPGDPEGEYHRSGYDTMTEEKKIKALLGAPFPYQWGVWTTALARAQLQRAIDAAGDKILYCDTDSIKVKGTVNINKLNEIYKKKAEAAGAYADDMNGKRHYIGLFEQDAHYDRFVFCHSKCYAYEKNGHLGVTVSGVTKERNEKTGEYFAVEELGKLENFQPGMVWRLAGGTMAVFNDSDDFDYTDPESGKTVHISKNVSIVDTTYELTQADDYKQLLSEIKLYGEYKWERE